MALEGLKPEAMVEHQQGKPVARRPEDHEQPVDFQWADGAPEVGGENSDHPAPQMGSWWWWCG